MIAAPRDNHAEPPSTALAAACATDLPHPATASFPWQTVPRSRLLSLCEAASDTGRREWPGPSGELVPAGTRPRAARRRPAASSFATASSATAAPSSVADALIAHLLAEGVGNEGDASLTAATPPSPALAPRLSPTPPRLTPSAPSARSVDPAHQGQDRLARTGAARPDGDAARIAAPCSAPATPEAREGNRPDPASKRPAEAGRLQNPREVGGTDTPRIALRIVAPVAPPEGIEPSLPEVRSWGPASTGGGNRRSRGARAQSLASTTHLHPLSRAAVTDATSSHRLDPERSERVDGERGSQSPPVCRPSAARLANTPAAVAVSVPRNRDAQRMTTPATHPAGAPA